MLARLTGAFLILLGLLLLALTLLSPTRPTVVPAAEADYASEYRFGHDATAFIIDWIVPPVLVVGGAALLLRSGRTSTRRED